MISIRIHGRGGQGVVTAAELIAVAAFYDGKFSQAFPFFGVERRGAPVTAFTKIGDKFIRERSQIYEPDYIILQDMSLLATENILAGAKKKTVLILNTEKKAEDFKNKFPGLKIFTVPATQIALTNLGKPIINTALLGAFAGSSQLIKFESLKKAISERFSGELGQKNIAAMEAAYKHCCPEDTYEVAVKN